MNREPKVHQRSRGGPWWTECGVELSLLPASRITDKFIETTCKTCRRLSEVREDDAHILLVEGHGD